MQLNLKQEDLRRFKKVDEKLERKMSMLKLEKVREAAEREEEQALSPHKTNHLLS